MSATDGSSSKAGRPKSRSQSERQPSPAKGAAPVPDPTYLVGMGGSAGGLEAFTQFFESIPDDTGMAFVVVQHLDPTRKGMMPQLLQAHTGMEVVQAADEMPVHPNRVYVIPPNCDLSVLDGALQLVEMTEPRGRRMPIDFFFRQMAASYGDRAVGVVLSGMGTDGTEGLRTLKEHFGLVFVQEPRSARYDSMPRSAIATQLVDYVAPPAELAAKLAEFSRREVHFPLPDTPDRTADKDALHQVLLLLRQRTGHDFSMYKRNTILRRLERRMGIHRIEDLSHYVRYLKENDHELDLLHKELLIGVTQFFRDPAAFDALKEQLLSRLNQVGSGLNQLRVWVAGCSTGEEAYSVAILLHECLEELPPGGDLSYQVFATDLDKDAIERARRGVFPPNIQQDLSEERLLRFFRPEEGGFVIRKNIRDRIVFAPQNMIMHPPFTKLDLICCRNLLIYLVAELQQRLMSMFQYALNPGGLLFLGSAETVGARTDLFTALDSKWRIYARRESLAAPRHLTPETPFMPALQESERPHYPHTGLLRETDLTTPGPVERLLAELYAPPSVVITDQGDIVYLHGRTGKYLEPPAGKANLNVHAMAREGLRLELSRAIRQAVEHPEAVQVEHLDYPVDGFVQSLTISVKTIEQPDAMRGLLLISFENPSDGLGHAAPARKRTRRSKGTASESEIALKAELQQTHERLQSATEQMASVQEELTSTTEEMQSANEELQSTNEELATTNAELQSKVSELSLAHDDMTNLINSVEIATLFVDGQFRIKRFTAEATRVINLIPADIGRPLKHVVSNLVNCDLDLRVREVVRTLIYREEHVEATDGRWYLMRIHPYRTRNDVIAGAVLTFTDITGIKELERSLRESDVRSQAAVTYAESILDTVREPLLILDSDLRVVSANRSYYQFFGTAPLETENHRLTEICSGQWAQGPLMQQLETVLPERAEVTGFGLDFDSPATGPRRLILNARRIRGTDAGRELILLAMEVNGPAGPA